MVPLISAFAIGLFPIAVGAVLLLSRLDPAGRRAVLRHPIAETRARLRADPDG